MMGVDTFTKGEWYQSDDKVVRQVERTKKQIFYFFFLFIYNERIRSWASRSKLKHIFAILFYFLSEGSFLSFFCFVFIKYKTKKKDIFYLLFMLSLPPFWYNQNGGRSPILIISKWGGGGIKIKKKLASLKGPSDQDREAQVGWVPIKNKPSDP